MVGLYSILAQLSRALIPLGFVNFSIHFSSGQDTGHQEETGGGGAAYAEKAKVGHWRRWRVERRKIRQNNPGVERCAKWWHAQVQRAPHQHRDAPRNALDGKTDSRTRCRDDARANQTHLDPEGGPKARREDSSGSHDAGHASGLYVASYGGLTGVRVPPWGGRGVLRIWRGIFTVCIVVQ